MIKSVTVLLPGVRKYLPEKKPKADKGRERRLREREREAHKSYIEVCWAYVER